MAKRRMFSLDIVDSDSFLEMPLSTQALYYHLGMRADDDGFINNPLKIMRMIGANKNDLDLLVAKRFILKFTSGIIVIKHWKINNSIRSDRYIESKYQTELTQLTISKNGSYTEVDKTELLK